MTTRTDEELVQGVRARDARAAGELYNRYWRAARATALTVTGNWASAEDAASEGFWKALVGIDSLADASRFAAWLRTIVIRSARAQQRSNKQEDSAKLTEIRDLAESAAEVLLHRELLSIVQKALRNLPERLSEVLALVYFEGYEHADAARFLDIPAGTLRRRLHEGRAQLRDAAETLLNRRTQVNDFDQALAERLKEMLAEGEIADAVREILSARPPRTELLNLLRSMPIDPAAAALLQLVAGSALSVEPNHAASENPPTGGVARAIRMALPEFQEWRLDAQDAAPSFLMQGDYSLRLKTLLPPGFAEGRPGSFLRFTRSLNLIGEGGHVSSVFDAFQQCVPHRQGQFVMSDAIDLTWMSHETINLYSVQEFLERLMQAVVPDAEATFASYTEPRYRAALQLGLAGTRAATGGVLTAWPGHPSGVESAHVRLLLEPWAAVHKGQLARFSPPPPA